MVVTEVDGVTASEPELTIPRRYASRPSLVSAMGGGWDGLSCHRR